MYPWEGLLLNGQPRLLAINSSLLGKFVTICRLPRTARFYLIDIHEFGKVILTSSDGMSVAFLTDG